MSTYASLLALGFSVFLAFPLPAQPPTLQIMTYNIHHCEGVDGQINIHRIADIIRKSNCDLVALQEVDRQTTRSQEVDQLTELARLTGLKPYFAKAIDYGGGEYGVAILSRHSATSQQIIKLPSAPTREQRVALHIVVQPESQPAFSFISTHLDHSSGEHDRSEQVAEIVKQFGANAQPTILAGDLNATVDKPELTAALTIWRDVDSAKLTPTIPVHNPIRKIDFIMLPLNSPWTVVSTQVLDEKVASDHLPLMAKLQLK